MQSIPNDKEVREIAAVSCREKQILTSFLNHLLEIKDDPKFTSNSYREGGTYYDFIRQLNAHCTSQPSANVFPFELRMARLELSELAILYRKDVPAFWKSTTGENAIDFGLQTPDQKLAAIRKLLSMSEIEAKILAETEPTQQVQSPPKIVVVPELRSWSDVSGKFSVEASLISETNGIVSLRKKDGQLISVPLSKLSIVDQDFVRVQSVDLK
jgi:hypothetical protein